MTYTIPTQLRNGSKTFSEVAAYFGFEDTLLDAIECLPAAKQAEALRVITTATVETVEDRQNAMGWYWDHPEMGHRIALTGLALTSEASASDTFRHELAHLLDTLNRGDSDHRREWKRWAMILGAIPTARRLEPVFAAAFDAASPRRRKVVARCTACGADIERARRSDFDGYRHPGCGGGEIVNVFETQAEADRFDYRGIPIILDKE